jgi:hypothetical protein
MDITEDNTAQLDLSSKPKTARRNRKLKTQPGTEGVIENGPVVGRTLTKEKRAELIRVIRQGLIGGMHPVTLTQACMTQFKLSRLTVHKYMNAVRQEQLKEVGYYREQIQEICQKALVTIVQNGQKGQAKPEAVVKAVVVLHNIFDIKVTPEDTTQQKKMLAEEAMAKMDGMSIQELQEFSDQLRNGGEKLTPEMLLMSPADIEETSAKRRKRKGRTNAGTS